MNDPPVSIPSRHSPRTGLNRLTKHLRQTPSALLLPAESTELASPHTTKLVSYASHSIPKNATNPSGRIRNNTLPQIRSSDT